MLSSLKTRLRRLIRGYQRSALYPVLLPHHRLTDTGVVSPHLGERELPEPDRRALSFCDGQHTLDEVAGSASASRGHLIAAQEQELILLWPSVVPGQAPVMEGPAARVILSPHPDDAALSLGGLMLGGGAQAGQTLVVNIFTKSAWWRFPPTEGQSDLAADLPAVQATRRAEDDLVSRLSGCPMRALDLDEALLRGHDMADIFTAELGERDAAARASIVSTVRGLMTEFPAAEIYIPLAIGRHVDHRLVRDAAIEALAGDAAMTRARFYEDLPYAATGDTSDFATSHPAIPLAPLTLDITPQVDRKIEMLRTYWSQFSWSQLPELKTHALERDTGRYVERVHGARG